MTIPRYQDRIVNGDQYADLLDTYIESYLLQYTKNELFEQARERQLPFSPVREMHEVLEEEQLLHLGLFREITHANGEQFTAAGSPFRWRNAEDDGPPETDPTGAAPLRAPRLGEHNDEVYGTLLGLDGAASSKGCEAMTSSDGEGPATLDILEGVRVLDLGMVWAGSICGQVLSDFGADVVKVESRSNLDIARRGRPIIGTEYDPNQNPLFHNTARNKRSLALNLKTDEGRDVLRRIVPHADILIENWRPGALPRLGFGYEELRKLRPDIIMISQTLAGQDGIDARLRAYGPTVGGITGLDSLVGYAGRGAARHGPRLRRPQRRPALRAARAERPRTASPHRPGRLHRRLDVGGDGRGARDAAARLRVERPRRRTARRRRGTGRTRRRLPLRRRRSLAHPRGSRRRRLGRHRSRRWSARTGPATSASAAPRAASPRARS